MSYPMMTVTGAASVLSWLPSLSAGASFALASGERTNTKRAGQELASVGPNLSRSYSARRVSSPTSPPMALWVRASRNRRASAASDSTSDIRDPLRRWMGRPSVESRPWRRRPIAATHGHERRDPGRAGARGGAQRRPRRQRAAGAGAGRGAFRGARRRGAPRRAGALAMAGAATAPRRRARLGRGLRRPAGRATRGRRGLRAPGGAGHARAARARRARGAGARPAPAAAALGRGGGARARPPAGRERGGGGRQPASGGRGLARAR